MPPAMMAPAWPMRLALEAPSTPAMIGHDRLVGRCHCDEVGGFFLGGTTDLTDHDDGLGGRIVLEHLQASMKLVPGMGSPPMPDAGGLAEPASVVCLTAS